MLLQAVDTVLALMLLKLVEYMVEPNLELETVFRDLVGLSKDNFDIDSCYQPYLVFVMFARNKIVSVGAGELGGGGGEN